MTFSNEKDFHDDFYDHDADHIYESEAFSIVKQRNIRFIVSQIPNSFKKNILSLGCGNGLLELMMAPHFESITASDISPKAIEIGIKRASEKKISNVKFDVADAGAVKFPDHSFDAVLALSLLHHVDEKSIEYLINEAYRVLKPGGVLITADPNKYRLAGVFKFFIEKTFRKFHSPDERELPPSLLFNLSKKAGFKKIKIHWIDFFYNPFCWVFPRTPKALASLLYSLDRILLLIPLLNKTASGFSIVAKK